MIKWGEEGRDGFLWIQQCGRPFRIGRERERGEESATDADATALTKRSLSRQKYARQKKGDDAAASKLSRRPRPGRAPPSCIRKDKEGGSMSWTRRVQIIDILVKLSS